MSWRRIGAINSRDGWVEKMLGVTSVDPNSGTLVEMAFTLTEEERDT